jgi:hypothetical protein
VGPLTAQQLSGDLHGDYSRGLQTHSNAWGGGAALEATWGGSSAPINLNTSIGGDYVKQTKGGPATATASIDITAQPGGNSAITPYVGGSVGQNWSTGDAKQWEGAKTGYEAVGGIVLKLSSLPSISWKAEERYGYINREEHTLATRVGILISM